jgi:N-acetyl-gamma-glutamyl-phosphate reductase
LRSYPPVYAAFLPIFIKHNFFILQKTIKVGIIGGAGYTAGELLRILVHHPAVVVAWVHSNSNANNPVWSVHTDLLGETDLHFSENTNFENVEVVFLCVGHGDAQKIVANIPDHIKIIDLSQDFRWGANPNATADGWVYGLPELNAPLIAQAQRVANPGCFATAIQLALLPLAATNELQADVHIHAITGSTGAGQKPSNTTHFSWRNNNMSIYEPFRHRHLKEIGASLHFLQENFSHDLNFLPVRGNFARGIFASVYTKTQLCDDDLKKLYQTFYADAAFTHVTSQNPDLKQVVGTNKAIVFVEKQGDKAFIVSMIDNLLKGASGQAVENMNLMFGLPQKMGLNLKSIAF